MTNLTSLIRQYKRNKSSKILNDIFLLLNKTIQDKAKYIFYQQNIYVNNKRCKLKDINKIDLEDIIQELKLEILRIINKYNPKKEFEPYFYATLWCWLPEIVRKKQHLNTINESDLYNEDEESINLDNFPASEIKNEESINIDEMFNKLTKQEKKLLNLMIKFPSKNQSELADILKLTQQDISYILIGIRKKYKINP